MELREYQQRSIDQLYDWFRHNQGNPCLNLPTGSGKSIIIASLCQDALTNWPETKIILLTHVKELIEQDTRQILNVWPDAPVGVYSASVGVKKLGYPITVAGIQSIRHKAKSVGHIDLCIVDEAHLISHNDEGSYRKFLDELKSINPNVRVIGLTATPYRLGHGLITDKPAIFDDILEPTSIEELLAHGFLSPLRSKRPDNILSTDGVNKRGGEFIEAELQKAVNKKDQNLRVACEIIKYAEERKAWLIFCTGVKHAHAMSEILNKLDIPTACITGETPKNEREAIVEGFKTGRLRALTNANCLTTGFDYPDIDLIAMCRPTLSPGLYCLDEETEVLTANGWKKEISVNEMVAGFNTQTKEIQYVPALNTIRRHLFNDEFFCSIKGPSVDIRVTNKHRMLYDTKNKTGWKFKNAEEIASLASGCYLPVAGNSKFKGVPLTNAELTFIGWVMTDGSINKTTNAIAITQGAHQPYLDEIEGCIKDCGFKFTRTQKKRRSMFHSSSDTVLWTISKGAPRGRDKHLTGWGRLEPWLSKDLSPLLFDMTAEQFATMLEAINHGDGHKNPWKAYHIGKGNKIFIERLQIMAIQRGYRASVSIERANVVRQSDLYILHIKKQEYVNIGSTHDKRPSWIKEPFKPESCWCVENELGTLVTRRNGKVVIVGNCQMAGRGMRTAPGKTDCLVLDFAGNVRTHGPITAVRPPARKGQGHGEAPVKVCEQCQEFVTLSTRVCPVCGWEFPAPEVKPLRLHNDDIMGNGKTMRVKSWLWRVYTSKSGKEMVTITYFSADNLAEMVTEYLCLLHGGYAQDKAQRLLYGIAKRAGAVIENPYDLEEVVKTMNIVPPPVEITKERDGKYYRVTGRVWNHAA